MGLFFRRGKKEKMGIPPPPPPEEGEEAAKEVLKGEKPIPELPPLEIGEPEKHLPSEMPEIKPSAEEKKPSGMPEFPEVPKEEAEEMPEEKIEEVKEAEKPAIFEEKAEAIEKPAPAGEIAAPKFVTALSFQTVLTEADAIRSSIRETENIIARINSLKKEEEKEFGSWRAQLEDVEKKLSYIDEVIFKGE